MKHLAIAALSAALICASPAFAEDKQAEKAAKPVKDYVILKVNGDEIKRSEVENVWKGIFPGGNPPAFDTFEESTKDNVLRGVASEHVIEKEAEKSGVQNSDVVKARIAEAQRQIIIQEFLKKKSKELVSDEKLKAVYDERTKNPEDEVHADHILTKTEEQAKEILKKIKGGGDFEQVAKDSAADKSSNVSNGDLGWFTKTKMAQEFSTDFADKIFTLKKGDVSEPIKSDFGWHIVKVEDRRKATPPTFEQMKEQLSQELGGKAVGDYINNTMKDVKITVYDPSGKAKELPVTPPKAADKKPANEQ